MSSIPCQELRKNTYLELTLENEEFPGKDVDMLLNIPLFKSCGILGDTAELGAKKFAAAYNLSDKDNVSIIQAILFHLLHSKRSGLLR